MFYGLIVHSTPNCVTDGTSRFNEIYTITLVNDLMIMDYLFIFIIVKIKAHNCITHTLKINDSYI